MSAGWPLRGVVIGVLTTMFLFSSAHVLVSRAMLRDAALEAEQQGVRNLIEVVSRDQLHQLHDQLIELGHSVAQQFSQLDPNRLPRQHLTDKLNEPFAKGFPLVREVDLIELRLYQLDLDPLANSTLGRGDGWVDPWLPPTLHQRASNRSGIELLKAVGGLWNPESGPPLYSVMIPVGGLRPYAFLEVVVDPIFNLGSIGETIRLPFRIDSASEPPSTTRLDEQQLEIHYPMVADDGTPAYRLTIQIDRSDLLNHLNQGFYRSTIFFLLLSFLLYLGAMRIFIITLIRPVDRMVETVDNEEREDVAPQAMPIGGVTELRRLADAFNRMAQRIRLGVDELRQLSNNDSLTGIANRRRFDEVLPLEWERARRDDQPISLLLVDVDYFKQYNDTRGHQAGDDCLQQIGRLLAGVARRPADLVARYGGEEFVVVLPGIDSEGATIVGERIRTGCVDLRMPHPASPISPCVTLSIGLATLRPVTTGLAPEALLSLADHALYAAKHAGRNRLQIADQKS
jgi:diguanylate cyclase (GGDEF)-like protein